MKCYTVYQIDKIMKYADIRKISPIGALGTKCIADFLGMAISPFFSMFFIKKNIKPNFITILMILFGVMGAILFSLPYIIPKILGITFFYLWYIMDCSDGEVARFTKQFSKYGKELDYMAHLICHPLMNLSLWFSYIQLNRYDIFYISLVFIIFISLELMIRNYISFDIYLNTTLNNNVKYKGTNLFRYIIVQFCIYPNFILLFPIIYLFDFFFDINSLIFLFLFLFFFLFFIIRGTYLNLKKFYYS